MSSEDSRPPLTLIVAQSFQEAGPGWAADAALSPDGNLLAIVRRPPDREYTEDDDDFDDDDFEEEEEEEEEEERGDVLLWDFVKQQLTSEAAACSGDVSALAFTFDGTKLICVGSPQDGHLKGEICLWDVVNRKPIRTITARKLPSLRSVAASPIADCFATGTAISGGAPGQPFELWQATNGQSLGRFGDVMNDVGALGFSPDGRRLAVRIAHPGSMSVWSLEERREIWQKRAHQHATWQETAFSPDGKLVASCGDKNVALWDADSGKSAAVLKGHSAEVRSLAFSPDGSTLATTDGATIRLWDVASATALGAASLPERLITFVAFRESGRELIALDSADQEIKLLRFQVAGIARPQPTGAPQPKRKAKKKAPPPSGEEQALVAAIVAQPDDDAPRLQYADWLDERQSPRGEFIRIQCRIAAIEDPRFGQELSPEETAELELLHEREQTLLSDHFSEWTKPLAALQLTPETTTFRRGFVQRLELNNPSIEDESLKLLAHAPTVEVIDLTNSAVTDAGASHLRKATNLAALVLDSTELTAESLPALRSLNRLVRVINSDWSDELETLKAARNRRFQKLSAAEQRAEAIRAMRIIVDCFAADENGRYPSISYFQSNASNADLVYLAAFPEVEELDLGECDAITDEGLSLLRPLKNLRTLVLNESGVLDLSALRHLTSLEALSLETLEDFDVESLAALAKLKKLHRLSLRYCRKDDEIIPHLARLKTLRHLDLAGNRVSNEALANLVTLTQLETLEVDDQFDRLDLVKGLLRKP